MEDTVIGVVLLRVMGFVITEMECKCTIYAIKRVQKSD